MDSIILYIESSTKVCSVAIGKGGQTLALVESHDAEYSHAEKLNLYIEEAMLKAGVNMKELAAIAVSKGPGSFTGLRIGVSTAKGLAYALDIPLIACSTLDSIAYGLLSKNSLKGNDKIVSMIDARRKEVYMKIFTNDLKALSDIEAKVIDENSFEELSRENMVHLIGDGAAKFEDQFNENKAVKVYTNILPSAAFMIPEAKNALSLKRFEDLAYFEPYYLKDFIAIKPRKIF